MKNEKEKALTVRQYLEQAREVDSIIYLEKKRCEQFREMAQSLRSPGMQVRVDGSGSGEAPFIRPIEMLSAEEQQLEKRLKLLVQLKSQICQVLQQVNDPVDRSLIWQHYVCGETWREVGIKFGYAESTVRRHSSEALKGIVLPPDAIDLSKVSTLK